MQYEITEKRFPMKKLLAGLLSLFLLLPALNSAFADGVGILKIKFFKVGKADAILLRTENHTVMIDTGEEDDSEKLIAYLDEKEVKALDYLILTHFDKDHIGSAPAILAHLQAGTVLEPDYAKVGDVYDRLQKAYADHGLSPVKVVKEMTFTLDEVTFTIIPAQQNTYAEDEDDDFSLVVSVRHGSNSFLFAGDIRSQRMQELIASHDLKHTLLKVPNHGINDDASAELFAAVMPAYAVIFCSDKNPASGAVLSALEALGTKVYQTVNGSIAITSDGNALTFKQ
jgi:competence protein ComEC